MMRRAITYDELDRDMAIEGLDCLQLEVRSDVERQPVRAGFHRHALGHEHCTTVDIGDGV